MINFFKNKSPITLSLLLLLGASIFALTFAYISQFVFDHQPCILCLYQRKPFFVIIVCAIIGLIFLKTQKAQKTLLIISIGCLLINCALSFYHVGVEQKVFPGPSTCSSAKDFNAIDNIEDLEAALAATKAIRCDEPTFFLLKLSMAAWNFIFCFSLILMVFLSRFFHSKITSLGHSKA